jgi:hypothetical protein
VGVTLTSDGQLAQVVTLMTRIQMVLALNFSWEITTTTTTTKIWKVGIYLHFWACCFFWYTSFIDINIVT